MQNKVKLTWNDHTVELKAPNDIDVRETLCRKLENIEDFKYLIAWAKDEFVQIFGCEEDAIEVTTDYHLDEEQALFFAKEKEEEEQTEYRDSYHEDEDDDEIGEAPKVFLQVHDIEQTKNIFPKEVYNQLKAMKCKLLILAWKSAEMTELCDFFVTDIYNDLNWRFNIYEPTKGIMGYSGEHEYKDMILALNDLGYKLID